MGIRGLTTYISNNPEVFYRDYALHDSLLLIDGNSLASQIYLELTVTNSAFGGDYERYRHSVLKFFKLLASCNVLPIVVFDGGYEKRKLKTTLARLKNTINGVKSFKSVTQPNVKLFPMFMKEVFKNVLKSLQVPCVQSDLEADFDLIYLSRKFNYCPILSYDSDFYINDIFYIPFFDIQLKGDKQWSQSSTGKCVHCKIYEIGYLYRHFGVSGLSNEFIPLLQCMLGNDYISHMNFRYFFSQLSFKVSTKRPNPISKRLAVLIKWCKRQTSLQSAMSKIIQNLRFHKQNQAIVVLKRAIKDYQFEKCTLYSYVMEQLREYNKLELAEQLLERGQPFDDKNEEDDNVEYKEHQEEGEDIEDDGSFEEENDSGNGVDEDVSNDGSFEEDNDSCDGIEEDIKNNDSCEEYNNSCNEMEEEDVNNCGNFEEDKYSSDEIKEDMNNDGSFEEDNDHCDENLIEKEMNSIARESKNKNQREQKKLGETIKHKNKRNSNVNKIRQAKNLHSDNEYSETSSEEVENESKVVHDFENVHKFTQNYLSIEWLVNDFRHGNICTHVANIINLNKIFLLPLRENIHLDNVHSLSFPILKVIAQILFMNSERNCLKVYSRYKTKVKVYPLKVETDENKNIEVLNTRNIKNTNKSETKHRMREKTIVRKYNKNSDNLTSKQTKVNCNNNVEKSRINIYEMPSYDIKQRQTFLLQKLGLPYLENLEHYPKEWNLFIISIIYWSSHSSYVNSFHVKSLLMSFIYLNIVQKQIGYFENKGSFLRKYAKKLRTIKEEIQNEKNMKKKMKKSNALKCKQIDCCNKKLATETAIKEEIKITEKEVATRDLIEMCSNISNNANIMKEYVLLYERCYLLSHMDEKLRSDHKYFNKDVIHTFCEYQSTLFSIAMLNTVLSCPYKDVDISYIYSGTFIYNIHNKIQQNEKNNERVMFENCTVLYALYNKLLDVFKQNTNLFQSGMEKGKKRKKKKKKNKHEEELETEEEREEEKEEEEVLIDEDNVYSILQTVQS